MLWLEWGFGQCFINRHLTLVAGEKRHSRSRPTSGLFFTKGLNSGESSYARSEVSKLVAADARLCDAIFRRLVSGETASYRRCCGIQHLFDFVARSAIGVPRQGSHYSLICRPGRLPCGLARTLLRILPREFRLQLLVRRVKQRRDLPWPANPNSQQRCDSLNAKPRCA